MARKRNNALFQDRETTAIETVNQATDLNESVAADEITSTTDLQQENLKLVQDNQELTERIVSYIEEINDLKNEISELKKKTVSANVVNDAAIDNLRKENDDYLMKISDLTFENAKLLAQVNELSKDSNSKQTTQDNSNKKVIKPQSINVPYQNQYRNNGYSDWN